jgi:hypothetical protein
MPIHLTLLDAATQAIADALALHDKQLHTPVPKRDPYQIARAVDSVHLGTDKLLKHIVAKVDPYLLLKSPKPDLLRNIRGALLHGGAQSFFSSKVRIETLDAEPTAEILRDVIYPGINQSEYAGFIEALKAIIPLRNHVQHGELFGDGDQILANVRHLLGEIYPVAKSLCPDFFEQLRNVDEQAESRLKAYKEEIDGAWQVLFDYLTQNSDFELEIVVDVWLLASDQPLGVKFSNEWGLGNRLSSLVMIPASNASGLFVKPQSPNNLGRALARAMRSQLVHRDEQPPHLEEEATRWYLFGNAAVSEVRPKEPILPLQNGRISIETASGQLSINLPNVRKRSYVTIDVLLSDWSISLEAMQIDGQISGILQPVRGSQVGKISAEGTIQLDKEYVLSESNESLDLPEGTTRWSMRGKITLKPIVPKE